MLRTAISSDALLAGLNPAQREAVEAPDGPLLIFAGAGSGKTRVLTHRIAHILASRDVAPGEICAVTFTNKAAKEMRTRLEVLLAGNVTGMWLGTFHSIGVRILRRDGGAIGIDRDFSIYDEGDRSSALKRAMQVAGIDEKRYPVNKIAHAISAAKNDLIDAASFQATAGGYWEAEVSRAYTAYDVAMRNANALDFDDLLFRTVELLRDVPEVRESYQTRFTHLFVDEYQDTNHAQYRMVSMLAEKHRNLTVVGDDDQCLITGTTIQMGDGTERRIEDVAVGDMVRSASGTGSFRSSRVTAVTRRSPVAPGVAITTDAGRVIVSTAEHTHFAGYRLGLSPHYRPRSRNSSRRSVVITLCGDRRGARPMHRISISGNDAPGREALAALGLSVRAAKRTTVGGWRFETCRKGFDELMVVAERIREGIADVEFVFTARLGRGDGDTVGTALDFIPAGSVLPGMAMFAADGGYDTVGRVDRVPLEAPVYDLNVEWTHNFIANGLITHNSVFGWRGADVRNILSFRRDYPDARTVTLEQNYRSTQNILDAAHGVIKQNTDRAEKQLWTERGAGETIRLISVYDEQEEAMTIASEIDTLIGGEEFALSDCAVLYRTNAQSRAFEDVLLRRGMPYRLVGGVRFYERREIKDVLAYLRLIANPRDAVAFARVVNVPRRKIGDKTVAELERHARTRNISPLEAVQHVEGGVEGIGAAGAMALAQFGVLLDGLREASTTMPMPDLLDKVLRDSGYERHLRDGTPEGEDRWANVAELAGLSGEYAHVPAPDGLSQFLENVALVSDVDTLDESDQGVTLITLHAVKGLEFPVVFIAGMEEGLLPHVRALEEGETGIAEERRLTYVGITRAERRLYLVHAFRRHLYGSAQMANASRFLADLPGELLEQVRRPGRPAPQPIRSPGAVRNAVHEHASRPNPVEIAPQRFDGGMRIMHARYGEGTILKSTMTRLGEEVVIKFDSAGMKIFAVSDAKLTILSS